MDVRLDVTDTVAVVTLDAPERRNALTAEMARQLSEVLATVEATAAVGALVVQGAGGWFCAGGDRRTLARAGEDPAADDAFKDMSAIYETFVQLADMSVPTIAAVRGGAIGAGLNLALAADVRIVGRQAVLLSGFQRIGVHPGGGHFQLIEQAAGPELAAAMALFDERIDGERAQRAGLALEALDDELVEARALELAGRIRDPELTRLATRSMREQSQGRRVPSGVALRAEQAVQMWSLRRAATRQP